MSTLATLARPYAKAAFELAQADQALSAWSDRLTLAAEMVTEPTLARLLESPMVGHERIVALMADAAGENFDKRFRDFLTVLASNDRLALLPQIGELFREFREEAEKRLSVRVVSAVPLDGDQAERMRAALAQRFDREIELHNEIDAGVIGGAVVYAGDQVIDGSLRGRLQKLSSRLAN
jgi:F-type H+-transporting ATPase subunit delta